jgi:hypothetical protein
LTLQQWSRCRLVILRWTKNKIIRSHHANLTSQRPSQACNKIASKSCKIACDEISIAKSIINTVRFASCVIGESAKIRFAKIRFTKIGFSKIGFSKIGFSKIGFSKIGFSKIGFSKIGFSKKSVRSASISSRRYSKSNSFKADDAAYRRLRSNTSNEEPRRSATTVITNVI